MASPPGKQVPRQSKERQGLVTVFKSLTRINPSLDKDYMTATPSECNNYYQIYAFGFSVINILTLQIKLFELRNKNNKIRFTKDWVEKAANIPKEFLTDPIEGSEANISFVHESEITNLSFLDEAAPENIENEFPGHRTGNRYKKSNSAGVKPTPSHSPSSHTSSRQESRQRSHERQNRKYQRSPRHSPEVNKLIFPKKQFQPIIINPKKSKLNSSQTASSSTSKPTVPPRKKLQVLPRKISDKQAPKKLNTRSQRWHKKKPRDSRVALGVQTSKRKTQRPRSKFRDSSKPGRERSGLTGIKTSSQKPESLQVAAKAKRPTKDIPKKSHLQNNLSISKPRVSVNLRSRKAKLSKERRRHHHYDSVSSSESSESQKKGNEDNHSSRSRSFRNGINHKPVKNDPAKRANVEEPVVKLYHHGLTSDSSSQEENKDRLNKEIIAVRKPKSILRQTLYYGKLPSHPHQPLPDQMQLNIADKQGDVLHINDRNIEGKEEVLTEHPLDLETKKSQLLEAEKIRQPEPLILDGMTVEYEEGFRALQKPNLNNQERNTFEKKAKPSLSTNPRLDWKNKPQPVVLYFQSKIMPQRRNLVLKSVPLLPLEQKLKTIYEENDAAELVKGKLDVKMLPSKAGNLEVTRHKISQLTLPSDSRSEGHVPSKRGSVLHPLPPKNSDAAPDA